MKVFHCDHCNGLVFFENSVCTACNHPLAFLPDVGEVCSLDKDKKQEGHWTSPARRGWGEKYRLCANYSGTHVCNWAVPAGDANPLCACCRLTRVIPDQSVAGNDRAWYKLEVAKRRLVYGLLQLKLPIRNKTEDPDHGLAFEFLADTDKPVLTGHDRGLITLNIAEANDAERERRKAQLHEPMRTLLGHFRHEVGHYYWDVLVDGHAPHAGFRKLFGDESQDYGEALKRHYASGPPADWQERHISTYATAHPWEDWAETWAHYMNMVDSLETAGSCGLILKPKAQDEPALVAPPAITNSFQPLIDAWYPLTYVLNNLNRGLGHADAYPFVLSAPVVEKLHFIHDTILGAGKA